jgi:hypothetical protein
MERLVDSTTRIAAIREGEVCRLDDRTKTFRETTFNKLILLDSLVVKLPTVAYEMDFAKFVVHGERMEDGIRRNERLEERAHLHEALTRFPAFGLLRSVSEDITHFAIVHKLQYERLRRAAVLVPEAKFGAVRQGAKISPAVFQDRIRGASLFEMFDFERDHVRPQYNGSIPIISVYLAGLLESRMRDHINWYIANFILSDSGGGLYYIDNKPTTVIAAEGNRKNIFGLSKYFSVRASAIRRLARILGLVGERR